MNLMRKYGTFQYGDVGDHRRAVRMLQEADAEIAEVHRRIAEMKERCHKWYSTFQTVAIALECLASTDPDENEHVFKAALQMERKR